MKLEVRICSNDEVLVNNCDEADTTEITRNAVNAGFTKTHELLGYGADVREDEFFRHWNGGKYDQFWKRCGLVAIRREYAGTGLEDIAWEVSQAMNDEIERLLAVVSEWAEDS